MRCPNCGRDLDPGDAFCENCGTAISSRSSASSPSVSGEVPAGGLTRRIKIYLVIGLVLAAAVAGGAYTAYGRGSAQTGPETSTTISSLESSNSPPASSSEQTSSGGAATQGAGTVTAAILPPSQSAEGGGTYSVDSSHSVMMLYQYLLSGDGYAQYYAGFVNVGTVTVQSINITVGSILNDSIYTPVPAGEFAFGPSDGSDFGYTQTLAIGSGPFPITLAVTYADGRVGHYDAGSLPVEAENASAAGSSLLSLDPPEHSYLGALQNGTGEIAINIEVDTSETFGLTALLSGNGQTIAVTLNQVSATYGVSSWDSCESCLVEGSTSAPIQGLKVGEVYSLTILSQYSYAGQNGSLILSPITAWPLGLIRVAPYNSAAISWPPLITATTTCDTNISRCGV